MADAKSAPGGRCHPLAASQDMTGQADHTAAPVMPEAAQRAVLVVDDEDYLRSILGALLQQAGYAVLLAATGEEAIEVYRRHAGAIHLVLLDVRLPGQGGVATL